MRLSDSWLLYFNSLESNDMMNKSLRSLATATSIDDASTQTSTIKTIIEDPDIVFMTVSPVTKQIKFLHSPHQLGGTRLRPTTTLVALDGFDRMAQPIIIDSSSLTKAFTIRTPNLTSIKTLLSPDDVAASSAPSNGRTSFTHAPFIILPPFIANAVIAQELRTPTDIFLLCLNLITQFDADHEEDDDFTESAHDNCKHILSFLWGTTKGLVPPVTIIPGSDDPHCTNWCTRRHHGCITPLVSSSSDDSDSVSTQPVTANIVQTLAHSITSQTEVWEKMRQDKIDAKDEKSNKFTDLHDSTQLMILNASSIDGEDAPGVPTDYCTTFFGKKNISKALDYLQTTLDQEMECCIQLDTGLVAALHAGHFTRDREDSPGNFSFFLTPKKQPLSSNIFRPTMILQLKASQGKGWSEIDLQNALKQGIITPNDIHEFGHQLKNFWGLSAFFFGPESVIAQALAPLLSKISRHTITFEGAQHRDKSFVTKLGYAIDTRVFRWLDQCRSHTQRRTVNDSLLNFDTIFDQVLTDSFHQSLPTTFKDFSTSTPGPPDQSPNETPRTKKARLNHTDEKERITNPKQIDHWIVSPSDYRTKVMGKCLDARPRLNNRPMCQRFHSKGYCFSDCVNKNTHIPSMDIDPTTQKLYLKYIDRCKRN